MSHQCKAIIGNMPGTLTDLQTIARCRPGFEMQLSSLQKNKTMTGFFCLSKREKGNSGRKQNLLSFFSFIAS